MDYSPKWQKKRLSGGIWLRLCDAEKRGLPAGSPPQGGGKLTFC
jgi:hypothetical protein